MTSVNENKNEITQNNNCELKFPLDITPVDPRIEQELLNDFTGEKDGYVHVGPKKYTFPANYVKHADHFYNFQAREDDIWIVTFPRSGTTWTQELVWMIAHDLDYDGAQRELLTARSPFFEFCTFMHDKTKEQLLQENEDNPDHQTFIRKASTPAYQFLSNVYEQRIIKTHFPFSMLPPTVMQKRAKVVYVARNPKDVAVSFYHLCRLYRTTGYIGDFPKFWDYFENDLVVWAPYWEHLQEGWRNRHEPNVLFMFYEDMNRDLPSTIRKVATFLNKTMTNDEVEKLSHYLSIEQFRNNPAVNQHELKDVKICYSKEEAFVRNGKSVINGWQKEYTPEIVAKAEKWIAHNLSKTDMRFPDIN